MVSLRGMRRGVGLNGMGWDEMRWVMGLDLFFERGDLFFLEGGFFGN